MIVILKNGVKEEKRDQLIHWLKDKGLTIHVSQAYTRRSWAWWGTPPRWTWTSSPVWTS